MATILAQSGFSVDGTDIPPGRSADTRFSVDLEGAVGDPKFSVEALGATALGMLGLAAPTGRQFAELILIHKGVEHRESGLAADSPVAIDLSPDGITWEIATHAFEGDEVAKTETIAWHGYAIDQGVAAPGEDEIDIVIDIRLDPDDDTSVQRYPVITGGRAWDNTHDLIGHNPYEISGGSFLSRFEGGDPVDVYRKPAGEERFHGKMITDILLLKGVPAARIAISQTLGHGLKSLFERTCFDGLAQCQTIAESIGHFLTDDADGNIVARRLAPVDLSPVATLNIEHLETAEVGVTLRTRSKGLPTRIRVEGQRPKIPAAAAFTSERKLLTRITAPFTTPAAWSQDSFGAVSQLKSAFTVTRIISETYETTTRFGDCVVQVRHETWKPFSPQVWRYETATPGTVDGDTTDRKYRVTTGSAFIFGGSVTKDDGSTMRRHLTFPLTPVLVTQTDILRDGPDGFTGAKIRETVSTAEWSTIEDARKASTAPSKPFEEEVVRAGRFFFAGGRFVASLDGNPEEVWHEGQNAPTTNLGGVAGMGGVFQGGNSSLPGEPNMLKVAKWSTQIVTAISVIDNLFLGTDTREYKSEVRRSKPEEAYGILNEGPAFEFRNGDQSNDPTHVGRLEQTTTEDYATDGVATHSRSEIVESGTGSLISNTFSPGQPSKLPDADICTPETAALDNNVPIFGVCEIVGTPLVPRTPPAVRYDFMEDEAAAAVVACRLLREQTAHEITCALPISPLFYAGAPILFKAVHKSANLDPDNYIDGVGKLSNAWIRTVEMNSVRDGAEVRRWLAAVIAIPIF